MMEGVNEPYDRYDSSKDFTSLESWKKCRTVKLFFYNNIIPLLPKEEKYNLNIQIRKASVSTTANIAEGYGRFYYKESIQFYRISRGSLFELKDHIISCLDLKYIGKKLYDSGIDLIEEAKVTLNGFIKYTEKKVTNISKQ